MRVLVVDDHDLMRRGIISLLGSNFKIVGEAGSGAEALLIAEKLLPELIIMDLSMPPPNGIETARQMVARAPEVNIILFTQQVSRDLIKAAFHAGVRAYVAKQSVATELLSAIDAIDDGGYYVTPKADLPELVRHTGSVLRHNPAHLIKASLTPRQLDVIRLIAQGKSLKEMAVALNVSVKTIEFHKNCVADELGLRTTAELTRYAVANGLLDLD